MKVNTDILNMDRAIVAFSGGPDSIALLHYLKYNTDIDIFAIHINHNLQADSIKWAKFCLDFCREHNIKCQVYDVYIEGTTGIENKAREMRYEAFGKFGIDDLITGHHGDDQIETLFLKLLRGAGISGVKAMEPISTNFGLTIHRPLLSSNKDEILEYCKNNNLDYVIDPSNNKNDYDRNIIRNKVLPILTTNFPHFKSAVTKSISAFSDADKCLEDLAIIDLQSVLECDRISIKKIRSLELPEYRIKNMLIYFMKDNNLTLNVNDLNFFAHKIKTISYDSTIELIGRGDDRKKLQQKGKYLSLVEW